MNGKAILKLAVSSLVLGTTVVGCNTGGRNAVNSVSAVHPDSAGDHAERAEKALAKDKVAEAVLHAEAAVAGSARDASYRMLLGRAYLAAGRFKSAETSFADTLALNPGNPRATLNLALAMIAQGKHIQARTLLRDETVPLDDADRGLAFALAGDLESAVILLDALARSERADARGRQNLAFTFAMQGRWREARIVASQDLSFDEVNRRLARWAQLAQPVTVADQVASLLGVTPSVDPGQPVQLALSPFSAPEPAAEVAITLDAPLSEEMAAAGDDPMPVAAPDAETPASETIAVAADLPSPVPAQVDVASGLQAVVFGPRQEIVQPVPAGYAPSRSAAAASPTRASAQAASAEKGRFVVQLGAYPSEADARAGWYRAVARAGRLNAHQPAQSLYLNRHYRLSVGGFATNGAAQSFCSELQASGVKCFARPVAGDRIAGWAVSKPARFAAR